MKVSYRLMVVVAACVAALAFTTSTAFASQLVYSDEFNGPLDTSTWANATPWNTQYTIGELEFYDPSDVTFANGLMTLTTEKRTVPGYSWTGPFDYTSGITTSLKRQKFSYGYFEVKAQLPKGRGLWPAFWLTNDSTLEIDGFEMLGDLPTRIYQTLHENKQRIFGSIAVDGPDYSAGFHTYGIDWQPSYVHWYVDGVLTASYDHPMPSDPLYICLNTAVGSAGSWPGAPDATTTFPVHYDIDYVRVYDTKPTAPAVAPEAYSTSIGATLTVPAPGVLANDTAFQGKLTAQPVTEPAHGWLTLHPDGSFVYVPHPGYIGTDAFTYTAFDGMLASKPAQVSLTVLAAGPTVVTKPGVRKKSHTTAQITGAFQVGTGSGITLASYVPVMTPTVTSPVTLRVLVQRWTRSKWRTFSTKTIVNPATDYSLSVQLKKGTYRVRSCVSGGGSVAGTSPWSRKLTIK